MAEKKNPPANKKVSSKSKVAAKKTGIAKKKTMPKEKVAGQEKAHLPAAVIGSNAPSPEPVAARHGFRRFMAGSCVLIACILLILSIYVVFIQQTVLNTDRYTANMKEIIKDPGVKKAVSAYTTEELFTALEVQKRISDVLPEKIRIAAVPATTWLKGFTSQQIETLLGTKQFQDIWVRINETAHKSIVAELRGETKQLKKAENGTVYIDLMPIVKDLVLKMTENTKLHNLVSKIPAETVGPALKTGLAAALGVKLPDDFGQLKIMTAEQLATAKQAVAALDAAATWVPIASLIFLGMALGFSVDRRRTTMHLGAGVAAAAAIAYLVSDMAIKQAMLSIADDTVRSILTTIVDIELRGLPELIICVGLIGAAIWVIAFLLGKRVWYAKLDAWVRSMIGYATPEDLAKHPLMRWINSHVDMLRLVLAFIALVVLLWMYSWWGVAAFGVILAIGEAKLRYLTGWYPFSRP